MTTPLGGIGLDHIEVRLFCHRGALINAIVGAIRVVDRGRNTGRVVNGSATGGGRGGDGDASRDTGAGTDSSQVAGDDSRGLAAAALAGRRRLKSHISRQGIRQHYIFGARRAIIGNGNGVGQALSHGHRVRRVRLGHLKVCLSIDRCVLADAVVSADWVGQPGGNAGHVGDDSAARSP